MGWLSQSAIPHREVLRGSAVESSAATPSVHSWESQGSPSRPISPSQCQVLSPKGRSVEGPGTPSVHTFAGFPAGCRVLGRDVSVGTPSVYTVQTHAQAVPVLIILLLLCGLKGIGHVGLFLHTKVPLLPPSTPVSPCLISSGEKRPLRLLRSRILP